MEKVYLNYRLEVLNKGGHSSVPSTDNAIYHLAEGLVRLGKFSFPVSLNATTRAYFARTAELESPQTAADIRSVLSASPDPAALARLGQLPHHAGREVRRHQGRADTGAGRRPDRREASGRRKAQQPRGDRRGA